MRGKRIHIHALARNKVKVRMENVNEAGSIEQLLTEAEAARLLTLSVRTLQNYREDGSGPEFIRVGRRIIYEPAAIRRWLDGRIRRSTCDPGQRDGDRAGGLSR